jgi:hypothetical protein
MRLETRPHRHDGRLIATAENRAFRQPSRTTQSRMRASHMSLQTLPTKSRCTSRQAGRGRGMPPESMAVHSVDGASLGPPRSRGRRPNNHSSYAVPTSRPLVTVTAAWPHYRLVGEQCAVTMPNGTRSSTLPRRMPNHSCVINRYARPKPWIILNCQNNCG